MSAPTTPPAEQTQTPHYSSLGRKTGSSKKVLKEKVVLLYDAFFKGEDPSVGNSNFWDEFFLLRANTVYIEKEFDNFDGEQMASLKETINTLFYRCVQVLKSDPSIRTVNSLQTIIALVRSIFKKTLPSGNYGFDIIEILMGFDSAESLMETLVTCLHNFLTQDVPASLKSLCLKLLLVLVTATDNVSQNTLLEYIMINSIFEALVQLLASPTGRQNHGHDAILVLTILVQYRKYESVNPYIVKLSILDDELALSGSAQVVSSALTEFNRQYTAKKQEAPGGIFSAFTSMVGSMFLADETVQEAVKANDSILLALYEALHLNRNFITTLTHSHTPSTPATPPSSPTSTKPTTPDSPGPGVHGLDFSTVLEPTSQPTNLLVTLLEYTSVVMKDTKDETRYNNCKLCLIILACISEDQYANSLMHDVNMNFRVTLHRMPMRHRKAKVDKRPPSRPLACALLDLMVEFIMSHMMKSLPMELYVKCLGITQRILCYQKKCRVRLQYTWKELWTALMNLLKFLMSNEATIMKKHSIFPLAMQIVNIFNLFITYGDTFLPTPASYDELYYELIRMHQVYDNLYSMALRYSTTDCESRDSAAKLANCLTNIRAIVNHFTPKVDAFSAQHQLSSLTEEQVLEVVRTNYDTLTLKLQESLDVYERYCEKPKESAFFTTLVRSIILDVRKNIDVAAIEHQTLIRDFAMIPAS